MRVLVTGATGFVGKVLVKQLIDANHEVVVLTRNIPKAAITLGSQCRFFRWENTEFAPPVEAFEGVDGVINLMGETISKRWDDAHKKRIYHSRIDATRRLVETIGSLPVKPKVFVSTSAIGIYGNRENEELTENSQLADDFLAKVCKDWETEANKVTQFGVRLGIIRVGVVLGSGGGALEKMIPIFKLGAGGPVGSGKQYMSWIQVNDLAAMYIEILTDQSLSGVFNGTAPYPATNADFSKQLGRALHRPAFAPAPAFAMRLMFGEMSTILLEGQKVIPARFKERNFRYNYPTLEIAIKESLR